MIKTIFCIICAISFVFALISGNIEALSGAVVDGAGTAVTLTISLMGMMALWCGVMKVMQKCGVCEFLARLISPLLRLAFPESMKKRHRPRGNSGKYQRKYARHGKCRNTFRNKGDGGALRRLRRRICER